MAGIDKITQQILNKAETEKEAILLSAEEEAGKIKTSAEEEIKEYLEKLQEKTEAKLKDLEARAISQEAQQSRRTLLKTRQEIISGLMNDAKENIRKSSPEHYAEILLKLLAANVQKNEGELRLSAEDLDRLPADFAKKAQAIAKEKGGSLTLSKEPAAIKDGFLLIYGDIEENCSLDAVFAAEKDSLTDLIHSML